MAADDVYVHVPEVVLFYHIINLINTLPADY